MTSALPVSYNRINPRPQAVLTDAECLAKLRAAGPSSTNQIGLMWGASRHCVAGILARMLRAGLVRKSGLVKVNGARAHLWEAL